MKLKEMRHFSIKSASALLALFMCVNLLLLTGCQQNKKTAENIEQKIYGYTVALDFASKVPFRSPYSDGSREAAAYIEDAFRSLGYQPERMSVSASDGSGATDDNIIVRIKGKGFWMSNDQDLVNENEKTLLDLFKHQDTRQLTKENKQIIIGAHYDTLLGEQNRSEAPEYNGLSGNASGIGVLLEVAKQLKDHPQGFDVVLIALADHADGHQGAQTYVDQMSDAEIAQTEGVYIVESIYAGDKLYAHAGRNALKPGEQYEKRRKLYELTDVLFESNLPDDDSSDILFNEGIKQVAYPPNSDSFYLYREFTLNDSDYVPFDQKDIPIVYIESANYDYENPEECRETKRPSFRDYDGHVRDKAHDNTDFLSNIMGLKQLEKRIHTVSTVLMGVLDKGIANGRVIQDSKN